MSARVQECKFEIWIITFVDLISSASTADNPMALPEYFQQPLNRPTEGEHLNITPYLSATALNSFHSSSLN